MTAFENLDDKKKMQFASLPYRVGLWVSKSDETGGLEADQNEMRALHSIITGFSQDFLKSEFVEQLMLHTMAMSEKWGAWGRNLDKVPQECEEAIAYLSDKLEQKDMLSFKITLMEIARNVALAFQESDFHNTLLGRLRLYLVMTFDNMRSLVTHQQPKTMLELTNISYEENKALEKLSEVLRVEETDGLENSSIFEDDDEYAFEEESPAEIEQTTEKDGAEEQKSGA